MFLSIIWSDTWEDREQNVEQKLTFYFKDMFVSAININTVSDLISAK